MYAPAIVEHMCQISTGRLMVSETRLGTNEMDILSYLCSNDFVLGVDRHCEVRSLARGDTV